MAALVGFGADGLDGEVRRPEADRSSAGIRARVCRGEEQGREERAGAARRGAPYRRMGGQDAGTQGWPRRHGHGMAPVSMVGPVEEERETVCEKPPSLNLNNYKKVQRHV